MLARGGPSYIGYRSHHGESEARARRAAVIGSSLETFKANAKKRAEWPREREMLVLDALAKIASGEVKARDTQAFAARECLRWQSKLPESQEALRPFVVRT